MNTQNNYSKHAEFWECFFGDRTEEIEFWAKLANRYGNKVLAPMAATGEIAAGLAGKGFNVVAVDSCQEMVKQGKRKYKKIKSLSFIEGDMVSLPFKDTSFDFAFFGTGDFHHFKNYSDQLTVLKTLHKHIKIGGGLALELSPPLNYRPKSRVISKTKPKVRRFEPMRPPIDKNVKLWKKGKTDFDSKEKLLLISQKLFVQRPEGINEYPYELQLRLFSQSEVSKLLNTAGYRIMAEYSTYKFDVLTSVSPKWIVLAEKVEIK
jgi:ubiquinone/menaquinone biosynthesis C-methylase UbiE